MITSFINSKLDYAIYKILEDGTYFGEIKGLSGVWANSHTLESCRKQLAEVLEDWVVLKIKCGEKIQGLSINFDRRGQFRNA